MRLKHFPISVGSFEEKLPANCKILDLVSSSEGSALLIVEASLEAELVVHKFQWVRDSRETPYDGLYVGSIYSYGVLESLFKLR